MAPNASNSNNLEQLALKELNCVQLIEEREGEGRNREAVEGKQRGLTPKILGWVCLS